MASEGPLSPSTVVESAHPSGNVSWVNPGNAVSSNNVYATATNPFTSGNQVVHWLKSTDFGFAIPAGATIDGIEVEVEAKDSGGTNNVLSNYAAVKAGVIGSDRIDVAHDLTTTDTYYTYGGPTNLLGQSWTPAEINDSGFGFAVIAFWPNGQGPQQGDVISVDHVRITVHYTEAGAEGTGALTLKKPIVAGTGSQIQSGAGDLTLQPPTLAATGLQTLIGSGTILLQLPVLAGVGEFVPNTISGNGAWILQTPEVAALGEAPHVGNGALMLKPVLVAASGELIIPTGTGALLLAPPIIGGEAQEIFTGIGALGLKAPVLAGQGELVHIADGAISLPMITLAGVGITEPTSYVISGFVEIPTYTGTIIVPVYQEFIQIPNSYLRNI